MHVHLHQDCAIIFSEKTFSDGDEHKRENISSGQKRQHRQDNDSLDKKASKKSSKSAGVRVSPPAKIRKTRKVGFNLVPLDVL